MSTAPRRLAHRPRRIVPASLLAAALLLLGLLGAWLLGTRLVTGQWPAPTQQSTATVGALTLGSPWVIAAAVVLAVVGLALLLAGLKPGTPSQSLIAASDTNGETVLPHRDVARWVRTRVRRVDGVQEASVSADRRRLRVKVTSPVEDRDTVRRACEETAREAVAELSLATPPRTVVTVDQRS